MWFLPVRCFATVVYSVTLSLSARLSNCPSQFGVVLKRLNVRSNKAHNGPRTRSFTVLYCTSKAARTCSATELRRTVHWLPVKQRIDYKLAVLTCKARQSGSPSYLASLICDYVPSRLLRLSDKLRLSRPYTSVVMADKAIAVLLQGGGCLRRRSTIDQYCTSGRLIDCDCR